MESKIIGNRIKELMNIEGISEKSLAKSLNLTVVKLEKKLNGEEEFYISEMTKIKEIFKLNLDVFAKLFFEKDFSWNEIIPNIYK